MWAGESISLLGDLFQIVAVSWLVLGLTGSGLALGTILVAAAIPRGIFMLLGGVLADRISPRDLALWSNVLRAVLTTIVALLVLSSRIEIWHLAAVSVVFGTVDAVFLPAINTLVPRLVPPSRLAAANALMQGTAQLMGTVGPAIAGFAIGLIGVAIGFVIDARRSRSPPLLCGSSGPARPLSAPRNRTPTRTPVAAATATATPAPDHDATRPPNRRRHRSRAR